MKTPAYIVLRFISLVLVMIGFVFLSFAGMQVLSPEPISGQHGMAMLSAGMFLFLAGIAGPVRIIHAGAQIPAEIRRMIIVQALVLPLSGTAFILSGMVNTPAAETWGCFVVGLLMLVSALAGFYPLSKKLPDTFYVGEMLSIIKSAGLTGDKESSPADRALMRWTHGIREGVAYGKAAPDGAVVTMEGETIRLSSYFGAKPLVLNFGSYSCPHHRKRIGELHALMQKWQHRGVVFLTVYTAEAHPEDDWKLAHQYVNDAEYTNEDDFCFFYAKSIADRKAMAEWLMDKKHFKMRLVLDSMENSLLKAYNSWPIRLYIINEGKIAFCGEQGPFGYDPASVSMALEKLADMGNETL